MYRLIYLEPQAGYKAFDSKLGKEIHDNVELLSKKQMHIICVVDYAKQSIGSKCPDFHNHCDSIDGMIFDPLYVSQF